MWQLRWSTRVSGPLHPAEFRFLEVLADFASQQITFSRQMLCSGLVARSTSKMSYKFCFRRDWEKLFSRCFLVSDVFAKLHDDALSRSCMWYRAARMQIWRQTGCRLAGCIVSF